MLSPGTRTSIRLLAQPKSVSILGRNRVEAAASSLTASKASAIRLNRTRSDAEFGPGYQPCR